MGYPREGSSFGLLRIFREIWEEILKTGHDPSVLSLSRLAIQGYTFHFPSTVYKLCSLQSAVEHVKRRE